MKTSARNCFEGTVVQVKRGAVNDEVELEVGHGIKITAIITHESTEKLGIKTGVKAFALVKASFVIVATDIQGVKLSTRNCLAGNVTQVEPGAVNSEVAIDLGNRCLITAIITNQSCKNMGLKAGVSATAIFKASSVILGVAS